MEDKTYPLLAQLTDQDLVYEEELLRNPQSLKSWIRYIDSRKQDASVHLISFLYERALTLLPYSYKLWKRYLDLRRLHAEKMHDLVSVAAVREHRQVNALYECSLRYLYKLPRLWIDYCSFLQGQGLIGKTRKSFDLALQSLPISQHNRIWPMYLSFARDCGIIESVVRTYRRYLKLHPEKIEDLIDYLVEKEQWDEAVKWLSKHVDRDEFVSSRGLTRLQTWWKMCEIICDHPLDIKCTDVDSVIRTAMIKFPEQVGKLWNALARYYILAGNLGKVRLVFEEGIAAIGTIREFTLIFDTYVEFEESVITAKMQMNGADADDPDIDERLAHLDELMDRRPFLVNDVLLKQNPNNVLEWSKRVQLCMGDDQKVVSTFGKALETINPQKATGRLQTLWIDFAKFYEELATKKTKSGSPNLTDARKIFEAALSVNFKHPDNLAECYIAYAEMELRHDNIEQGLEILGRGTAPPNTLKQTTRSIKYLDDSLTVRQRLFKSLKLWNFYVDVEESLGHLENTRAIYDRMLELKIVVPQTIINYAVFLEENKYFEDSFRIYQRGIDMFGYPIAFDIWNIYLQKFIQRYGGTKVERTRDLFEQALDKCPSKFSKTLYLLFAKFEEEHGLPKRAMEIYNQSLASIESNERFDMFQVYIAKAITFFGLTYARPIFEKALEILPDKQAKTMAQHFIEFEMKLGEVDRARAIYSYASQFSNPELDKLFWQNWHDFEVHNGNEETYKDMLRIKRSVQAKFNEDAASLAAQIAAQRAVEKPSEGSTFILAGKTLNGRPIEENAENGLFEGQDEEVHENPDEIKMDYMDDEFDDDQPDEVEEDIEPVAAPQELFDNSGIPAEKA